MLDEFIKDKHFFNLLINHIDFPFIYLSENKSIEIANNFAIELLQLNPDQHIGVNIQEFFLKHNYPLSKLFVKNDINSIEETYVIGGKTLTIMWKIKLISHTEKKFNDGLLIGCDVTQYKLISEELNSKIFFYENILSKLPTNVYWKDRNSVYLGCNERLSKVMGLASRDAVKGMTDFDFSWNKEAAESFIEFDKKVIQSGAPLTTEDVFEEASGKVVTVLTNKTPLKNEAGDTIGILAISVDITELKQTQEKLKIEKQKSEASSKAKSEFIANMSHDLRTPITGMLGMVQDMLNTADQTEFSLIDTNSTQCSIALQNIIETVKRDGQFLMGAIDELLQLCNEILDITRFDAGKLPKHSESFNLRELIEHNIDLLQPVAQNKQLNLSHELDQVVPHYLKGLRIYLDRILLNLISNALKFTETGFVKIRVELEQSNSKNFHFGDQVTLRFFVEDSGIGIPKDKFEIIFDHFSRLTPAYEGLYKGSGLGLYTVKRYVEAMEGTIDIESEIGQGTCFTVALPFTVCDHTDRIKQSVRLPKAAKPGASAASPRKEKPTLAVAVGTQEMGSADKAVDVVLVVEDNALAAIAVKLALKPFNCHIEIAQNGTQAVEMAQEGHYDLILMDIGLPDFSGIEATKKIRAFSDPKKSQVPIVALTGHANNPEMRQESLDAGMQDVMSKPAQPLALESLLKYHGKHQQFPPKIKT